MSCKHEGVDKDYFSFNLIFIYHYLFFGLVKDYYGNRSPSKLRVRIDDSLYFNNIQ